MNDKEQNIEEKRKDTLKRIDNTKVNASSNKDTLSLEEMKRLFGKKLLEFQEERQKKQPNKAQLSILNSELTFLRQKINSIEEDDG